MYHGKHFAKNEKRNIKSIVLAVVAMIELLLLSVTMSFSWFEGTTALKITTDFDNLPAYENLSPALKTASGLKSSFTVGEGKDYQVSSVDGELEITDLNQYFEQQANAKFSPVSSYNGETFYALMDGTISDGTVPDSYDDYLAGITTEDEDKKLKFRELSNEEKNSSVVYFQFKVTATTGDTSFWLKELPTFEITSNGTTKTLASDENPFRIRIDDGTGASSSEEHNLILSDKLTWPANGYYVTDKASRNNMLAVKSLNDNSTANLKLAADILGNRTVYKVFSKTSTLNKNGKEVLFTVPKGETKTITIAIWLEALDQSYSSDLIPAGSTVDVDIQFCSSWDVVDTITFRDYTAEQWIDDSDNSKTKRLGIINEDNTESRYWYGNFVYDKTAKAWTGEIPRAVQNIKFVWQDVGSTNESVSWLPATRGTNTVFTAFGSTAGLWYSGTVTQIGLSDYTNDSWLYNDGDDGNPPKMKVEIDYSGTDLKYSMTSKPVADKYGKNTWYAYIPSSVDDVIFDRCDSTSGYVYNYWNATDRGTETIYRVYDTKKVEVDKSNTVYLQVPASIENTFFKNQTIPHISLTGDSNLSYINSLNGDLSALEKNNSYYPQSDTWPTNSSGLKNGQMTKIEGTFVWYYEFDSIADADAITFWDCDSATHYDLDSDTRFAPGISFDKSKGNMFIINGYIELDDPAFTDTAYVFTGYWDFYGTESGDTEVDITNGVWGEYSAPTGTKQFHFMHLYDDVTSMTAECTFDDTTITYSMTKSSSNSKLWSTSAVIPSDYTGTVVFTDNSGREWTATGGNSSSSNYCYAIDHPANNKDTDCYKWRDSANYMRVYFTNNKGWNNLKIHYWTSSVTTQWPGDGLTFINNNSYSQDVYVKVIPTGSTIVFNNGDSSTQTVDISGATDMIAYSISNDSNKYTVGTWTPTSEFFDLE